MIKHFILHGIVLHQCLNLSKYGQYVFYTLACNCSCGVAQINI